MSKLGNLAAAAIAFVAVKRLTDTKPTVVTATKPLITQGFITGPAATGQDFSLLPTTLGPTQVTPSIDPLLPTGPIKQPSADIPLFVPFDILGSGGDASGLKGLPDFGNLPTKFNFDIFGFKDR